MSHEVTLPSGATAVIRDGDDLTYGDREDMFANASVDSEGGRVKVGGAGVNDFYRKLFKLGIESWTCIDKATSEVLPLPSEDEAVVRKLRSRDGAFLAKELMALQKELFPDFDVAAGDGSPTSP